MSTPAGNLSNMESKLGMTTNQNEAITTEKPAAEKGAVNGSGQTEEEKKKEAERLYEERIEEEYAKREGGA